MRIAVYSRKSRWTGRGDSVENQVAMCREYIEKNIEGSQKAEIYIYEDEGFSGKNTKRPQFQKMLSDMKLRHFDYLVCYRLDRLGRNIGDLAVLIEKLNREHTEFVSIKERFDTTTPMGKAMLYFSGVLAQMEREQIAERVRDNMVMLARKGRWLGGNTPLGFYVREETESSGGEKTKRIYYLETEETEILWASFMFQEYIKQHSLKKVASRLQQWGILTRNGKPYSAQTVRDILTNPVYCCADQEACTYFRNQGCQVCLEAKEETGEKGLVAYGKTVSGPYKGKKTGREKWILAVGKHRGIISGKDFVKVQTMLDKQGNLLKEVGKVQNEVCLLSGILYCSCNHKMRPKYYSAGQKTKEGQRKFSYRCTYRDKTCREGCQMPPVQGNRLDEQVWEKLLDYTRKQVSICSVFEKICTKLIKSEKIANYKSRTEIAKLEIKEKEREIRRLTEILAKTNQEDAFSREIETEIKKRFLQKEKLEAEIEETEGHDKKESAKQIVEENLVQQCSSFEGLFSMLDIYQKREYVRLFTEQIVWDGIAARLR